jgi:hypothetical protein
VVCSRLWNNAKEQRAQRPFWCYKVVSVVGVYFPARWRFGKLAEVTHYHREHLESSGRGRPSYMVVSLP